MKGCRKVPTQRTVYDVKDRWILVGIFFVDVCGPMDLLEIIKEIEKYMLKDPFVWTFSEALVKNNKALWLC